ARETSITVYLNQQELVSVLCTPARVNYLVLGFLYNEGIIDSLKDVASMRVCDDEQEVDVRLSRPDVELPQSRTLTSGCGGGSMLGNREMEVLRVDSDVSIAPSQVSFLMKHLLQAAEGHKEYGGFHTSALADEQKLLIVSEDIGRHNTLDKIMGECLVRDIPPKDRLVLSTGRVSSEMLLKVARMGIPIVVSRGAVTGRSVHLARELGITLVGYARGERMTVYTRPKRVGIDIDNLAYRQRR
ncbi:formate dehydrogenase accessory sulfurtransferase FdhD, partial [Chloroflexota bacterium]